MRDPVQVRDELARRFLGVSPEPRRPQLAALQSFIRHARYPAGVHAVGLGGERSVVLYVTGREAAPEVPARVDGVEVRVVESPMARLAGCSGDRKKRVRPLVGGIAIEREGGPVGTLGAFARSTRDGDGNRPSILSNSHVLAPPEGRVRGTPVFQGGERVGAVLRASRLHLTVPIEVDAAVAEIDDGVPWQLEVCGLGPIGAPLGAAKDMRVVKHGRTSALTVGRITDTGVIAEVEDPRRETPLRFLNLIRVDALSKDDGAVGETGDSGALVVEEGSRRAVGLLNAVDPYGTFYYANPIATVCRELEIELLLS